MSTASPITDSIRVVQHRADAATWWVHIAIGFTIYYLHLAAWTVAESFRDTTTRDRVILVTGAALVAAGFITLSLS